MLRTLIAALEAEQFVWIPIGVILQMYRWMMEFIDSYMHSLNRYFHSIDIDIIDVTIILSARVIRPFIESVNKKSNKPRVSRDTNINSIVRIYIYTE